MIPTPSKWSRPATAVRSTSLAPPFRTRRGTPLPPRKHIGIYAYRKAALRRFAELPPSPLESAERLEQLRLLEEGISIHVVHTTFDTIGVDTEEDLLAAEQICCSVVWPGRAGGSHHVRRMGEALPKLLLILSKQRAHFAASAKGWSLPR